MSKTKTEGCKMNSIENLPMMLSANDIQSMGFARTMVYKILSSEDVPVVKIGNRKFVQRDKFFAWLDSKEREDDENGKV
jgi:hypothetical protein